MSFDSRVSRLRRSRFIPYLLYIPRIYIDKKKTQKMKGYGSGIEQNCAGIVDQRWHVPSYHGGGGRYAGTRQVEFDGGEPKYTGEFSWKCMFMYIVCTKYTCSGDKRQSTISRGSLFMRFLDGSSDPCYENVVSKTTVEYCIPPRSVTDV